MPVIRHLTTGTIVAGRAERAAGFRRRMVGLLSRAGLGEGEALILPRCRSIHTWFMRFPIDVIFLKSDPRPTTQDSRQHPVMGHGSWVMGRTQGVIVRLIQRMRPFQMAAAWGADTVVELPAGVVARTRIEIGELLEIT